MRVPRVFAVVLLVAAILQTPMVTWAAMAQPAPVTDSVPSDLGEPMDLGGGHCAHCCPHGEMPACAAHCALSVGVLLPSLSLPSLRLAVRGDVMPDERAHVFVDHVPPNPLRPPIV